MGKQEWERRILDAVSRRLVSFLASRGVSPTALTSSALILALLSALFYYFSAKLPALYYSAAVLFLFSGFLDAIDGAVARASGRETERGAFLDSVMDKLGECAVLAAITGSGAASPLWGSAALASSIMVSYVRARAEALRVALKGVGFMERAERMILVAAASIIEPTFPGILNLSLIALTILSLTTVIHRVIYAARRLQS